MAASIGMKKVCSRRDGGKMKWISVKDRFPDSGRVLTYSPDYLIKEEMTYRILDAQFVRICIDVTHWLPLEPPIKDI
jgi:hypothetical protein